MERGNTSKDQINNEITRDKLAVPPTEDNIKETSKMIL